MEIDSTVITPRQEMNIKRVPKLEKVNCEQVYLAKTFEIVELPVSVSVSVELDDSYIIFLNGEYIATFMADDTTKIQLREQILTDGLVSGTNILAFEVIDSDYSGGGFSADVAVSYLPGWEDKKQQILFETSDQKIKENLLKKHKL